eukprot:g847.t1
MSNTLLERVRVGLEQTESLDRLIIEELKRPLKTRKDQTLQSWKLKDYLNGTIERSKEILQVFRDEDGFRKEEIERMSGADAFENFYEKLQEVKQYHRRFSDRKTLNEALVDVDEKMKKQFAASDNIEERFSGEEHFGKYLDLHQFFVRFVNVKGSVQMEADNTVTGAHSNGKREKEEYAAMAVRDKEKNISYRTYLDIFGDKNAQHAAGIRPVKSETYRKYLSDLVSYLESFRERAESLLVESFRQEIQAWKDEFERREREDVFANYKLRSGYLNLEAFESVAALEKLGPDRLKAALQAFDAKCGGSCSQKAQRLFAIKTNGPDYVDAVSTSKKRRRRRKKRPRTPEAEATTSQQQQQQKNSTDMLGHEIRRLEFLVAKFSCILAETIQQTKRNVEQKQIRTWEELRMEIAEAQESEAMENAVDSSDDEEDVLYNPSKVVLGWDGKPIPYWLYRLHGLSQEFTCEICGNFSYRGRRDFDRHFQEPRHASGMRALGIPNTKHFHDVTSIKEAQLLYKKLLSSNSMKGWNADDGEEFEDSEGNVLSKKMYLDLSRQGLL